MSSRLLLCTLVGTCAAFSLSPQWAFRYGKGRDSPVPLGGTEGWASSNPRPTQPVSKTWASPEHEFKHGSGRTTPVPLGGTS